MKGNLQYEHQRLSLTETHNAVILKCQFKTAPMGADYERFTKKQAWMTLALKQFSYFRNPHKYCPVPLESWVTPQQMNVYNKAHTRRRRTFNLCQRGAAIISWDRPENYFSKTNMRPGAMDALYLPRTEASSQVFHSSPLWDQPCKEPSRYWKDWK